MIFRATASADDDHSTAARHGQAADPRPADARGPQRERSAEPRRNPGLELFFDLVFVLCVAQLADALHETPTWSTALKVGLVFVPVWWTWNGVTFALNRFPNDDNWTNLGTVVAAAASGAMAIAIPSLPGRGNDWFALGYATVRIVLSLLYRRARTNQERLTGFYSACFAVLALVWLASLLVPRPVQPYVWAAATVADLLVPALADRTGRILPVDEKHLPDRFSAFTIIVLGEAAVNTVAQLHGPPRGTIVVILIEGFLLAALLWWGFFDRAAWLERYRLLAHQANSGRAAYIVCAVLHFPLVVGITLLGAGTQVAVSVSTSSDGLSGVSSAVMVAGGIAIYLATLNVISWVLHTPRRDALTGWRFVLLAAVLSWLWLGREQQPARFLVGCAVILIIHTVVNVRRSLQFATRERLAP